jgi:hypothetical protein
MMQQNAQECIEGQRQDWHRVAAPVQNLMAELSDSQRTVSGAREEGLDR